MRAVLTACLALLAVTSATATSSEELFELFPKGKGKDVVSIIKINSKVVEEILGVWEFLQDHLNMPKVINKTDQECQLKEVLTRLNKISYQIQKLETGIEGIERVVSLFKNTGKTTRLELRLHEMADLVNRVDAAHMIMMEYTHSDVGIEDSTLEDFAHWGVSHDPGGVRGLLERIHSLVVTPYRHLLGASILELVLQNVKV